MDTVTKLNMAVGLLTRPSKHRLVDPDTGASRWVTADPLLTQLEIAVGNSSAAASFKASSGTPLPISADAFDLLRKITAVTWDHWWNLYGQHFGQGRDSLAGRIRAWGMAAQSDPALTSASERILTGWVESIQGLFEPVRRREIQGSCPKCEATRMVDHVDEDGGTVTKPVLALVYTRDGQPGAAVCGNCKTQWQGQDIWHLARHVTGGTNAEQSQR